MRARHSGATTSRARSLAGRPRPAGRAPSRRRSVGAADVDHEHVAALPSTPSASASTSTPARTASGVGARTSRANGAPAGEPLAADHVLQEQLADRRARAERLERPIRGSTFGATTTSRPRRSSSGAALRAPPRRCRRRRRAPAAGRSPSRRALCSRTSASPPSVPPASSTTSGAGGAQAADVRRRQRAGVHVHDPAAGRQRDPAAGLRGDQPLVPDDRDPQAAARAGAGQHLARAGAGLLLDRRPDGVGRRAARRRPARPRGTTRGASCGAPPWRAARPCRRRRARPW